MLVYPITYKDFDGDEQTEKLYFNLTTAELLKLQMSRVGGFQAYLQRLIEAKNEPEVCDTINEVLLLTYGEKSADGKRFDKSDELRANFENSAAYSVLFTKLCLEADEAVKFFNGVMPPELVAEVQAMIDAQKDKKPSLAETGSWNAAIQDGGAKQN